VDGLEGDPKAVVVFPYPARYGGTLTDDQNHNKDEVQDDNMMAFRIGVS
jgi:hypothetical protein